MKNIPGGQPHLPQIRVNIRVLSDYGDYGDYNDHDDYDNYENYDDHNIPK